MANVYFLHTKSNDFGKNAKNFKLLTIVLISVLGKYSYAPENAKEIMKFLRPKHLPKLADCRVPVNVPIFASMKYFFSQLTLRICHEYTPYENVDLCLKNNGENVTKT